MYQPTHLSRSEFLPVRHHNYHVRRWGADQSDLPALVLVHGWMDMSASYQFVIDALDAAFVQGRTVIAPDWRGFGLTKTPAPVEHYVFADYLGDLDVLLDHYSPGRPVDLVGHSMGGNVATMYAGVRPGRIRRLVNLEGFGSPDRSADKMPKQLGKWLDELQQLRRGEMDLKTYNDAGGVAQRLMKTNRRLPQNKADWLATHWARPDAQGRWGILGDAAHKVTSAILPRLDETLALYAAITAPTLAVEASDDSLALWWKDRFTLADYHQRLTHIPSHQIAVVQDAAHMLHHDQPEQVARLIESFLA